MKRRLGDLLVDEGLLDEHQLRAALGHHRKWGVPLGQVVVDLGFCSALQVLDVLAWQVELPTVDLDAFELDPELMDVMGVEVAEDCQVIPLAQEGSRGSVLVVACPAPAHPPTLDEVARMTGASRLRVYLATDAAIGRALERLYYPHLRGAGRPAESIELPEADERMPLVRDRAEYLRFATDPDDEVTIVEHKGLPILPPLKQQPARRRFTQRELSRAKGTRALEREPEVWVYGWGSTATRGLLKLLKDEGLRARVASTHDVRTASARAVVLAPVQSLEGVSRRPLRTRLVLAGRTREKEQARTLGARRFLSGPLCPDVLLDAVREQLAAGRAAARGAG